MARETLLVEYEGPRGQVRLGLVVRGRQDAAVWGDVLAYLLGVPRPEWEDRGPIWRWDWAEGDTRVSMRLTRGHEVEE